MIHSASFQNFKGLRNVRMDFEPFTVVVGPNASGKSSILQGLAHITRLRQADPDKLSQGDVSPSWLIARNAAELQVEIMTEEWGFRVSVSRSASVKAQAKKLGSDQDWVKFSQRTQGRTAIPAAVLLRLDPKRLASPSSSSASIPRFSADGDGFASALAYLALNQPAVFTRLKELLRELFPFVANLRFHRAPLLNRREPSLTR